MTVRWSEAALSVWGKTDRDTHDWLPVVQHLEDAAQVMGHLWDEWVPDIVKRRLGLHLGSADNARRVATWLAGVHDVGKATPAFAVQARDVGMGDLIDAMDRQGLRVPSLDRHSRPHHSVTGHLVVQHWLRDRHDFSVDRAAALASVVGGHHGVPPSRQGLEAAAPSTIRRAWGEGLWDDVRAEVLDTMTAATGVAAALDAIRDTKLPLTVLVDLSALVIVADWLASDASLFPYDMRRSAQQRLADAVSGLDLPPPWAPQDPGNATTHLRSRFPHLDGLEPSDFQRASVEGARLTDGAPLIVIEAPTGSGKSEAALMAAETLAARHGCGGVFVALPTMATSDAMFSRVLRWVRTLPQQGETSIYLAHGKHGLNEDFAGLVRESWVRGVYDAETSDRDERRETIARVSSWLNGRKKGLLANVVVGTIDQVLMGGLKTRHLALRHLALSGKVVVVDEVHAADDYMRGYLTTMLRYLGAYGTPVVLLSATLPPAQRQEFTTAYASGRVPQSGAGHVVASADESDRYPRITTVTDTVRDVPVLPPYVSRDLQLAPLDDDPEALVREITGALSDGGCAAVIRNTVRRAQETHDTLREHFGDDVELFHSRFLAPHRATKETHLLARLGPPESSTRPQRLVVVGTQVLEQSLDIDVDLLVTDLAPVDLVLQRVGRLHRHRRESRPAAVGTPRCLVTGVQDWQAVPPIPNRGSKAVYGASRLLRSAAVLGPHLSGQSVRLPHDVPGLVRRGYDPDLVPPGGWEQEWRDAETDARRRARDQRRRSQDYRIAEVGQRSTLVEWLNTQIEEQHADGGRAQVRDSEDSVEVILVQWGDDGGLRTLPGLFAGADRAIPVVPDDHSRLTRQVAACTVRLPTTMTLGRNGDRVIEVLERAAPIEGWQQSRWLQGQLVLPLDVELRASLAGFDVAYSHERGLTVTRTRPEDEP